jgi:D-arginine dehydrogenase
MSDSFDILVVGGGISGVSLAARLAPHVRVAVAEAEEHIGTHATGRSAALLVEAYGASEIRRLTKASRIFFENPPEGFADAPLSQPRGAVIYGSEADLPKLREEFELARETTSVVWLEGEALASHCPLLRPGLAVAGYLESGVLDLDANALLQGFARSARRDGAEIWTSAPLRRVERQPNGWKAEVGARTVTCGILVDAAGAWADDVAALAGVALRRLQPMRRTAATITVSDDLALLLSSHPFAAPVDGSFYFKPDAGAIMVSLSDATPSEPCDAYADDFDVALALDRFHAATIVPLVRPIATWAGLRTFAPDGLPIIGFDPVVENFFWYAGQGGTGIQTSPAASTLAARLLLGEAFDGLQAELAASFRADRMTSASIEIAAPSATLV